MKLVYNGDWILDLPNVGPSCYHGGTSLGNNYIFIMSILPKGRSFTANSGTKAAVLLKGRSSTTNSWTQSAVLLGMDRCGSSHCFSHPTLFIIGTDLKRSEKIPGAPTWRWGEWIWLTGPSGLHQNSPQGLNIGSIRVSDQIRDPEIPINLRPQLHINDKKMIII